MITKSECVSLFNNINNNSKISLEKAISLILDYLTEINCKYSDKLISLIIQNPSLVKYTFPTIIDYFCRKYNIFSLEKPDVFNNYKKIMYYE